MAQFDINVEEILYSLGKVERREIFDSLSEEFEDEDGPRLNGKRKLLTPTEFDFQNVLLELWSKRSVLTPDQIDRVSKILTEPFVQ